MNDNNKLDIIYKNMQNGNFSKEGFLGNDKRTLKEIISGDESVLQTIGIAPEIICDKLNEIASESKKGLGETVKVDDILETSIDETRGHLECPFEDGVFRKNNIKIKNLKSGKSIIFSELTIHMIKEHHFFQGKGSTYRLEPEILKEILNL